MVVGMAVIAVWIKIDEERVVQGLQEAGKKLDSAEGEVVVDFSSVGRIDPSAIQRSRGSPTQLTTKASRSRCAASTSMFTKCSSW